MSLSKKGYNVDLSLGTGVPPSWTNRAQVCGSKAGQTLPKVKLESLNTFHNFKV